MSYNSVGVKKITLIRKVWCFSFMCGKIYSDQCNRAQVPDVVSCTINVIIIFL